MVGDPRPFVWLNGRIQVGAYIKICGVTSEPDAVHAENVGADAIGLNFHPASPRCIDVPRARGIVQSLRSADTVGVFVEQTVEETRRILDETGIHIAQLHGNQSVDFVASLGRPAIRAFRHQGSSTLAEIRQFLVDCERMGVREVGLLVDAYDHLAPGGTGKTVDWTALSAGMVRTAPWLLAGGLTPENVKDAIAACRPWGVDVASGVESEPGVKDPAKVEAFVRNVRDLGAMCSNTT